MSSPPPRYDPAPDRSGPHKPESSHHAHFQPLTRRSKPSLLDELLPLPSKSQTSISLPTQPQHFLSSKYLSHVLRRTLSLAVVVIFLLSITFLACTQSGKIPGSRGLKEIFGVGEIEDLGLGGLGLGLGGPDVGDAGWVGEDLGDPTNEDDDLTSQKDFDKYTMMLSIPEQDTDVMVDGKRLIFIGDVHGSFDPLQRLMAQIDYDSNRDKLIHVGDLVAKGSKSEEVLQWMIENRIQGVRGNHDHPVIQWRSWMEWAGGEQWEEYIDNLSQGGEGGMLKGLGAEGKMFPKGWEWKGEHWQLARTISQESYRYLVDLPLVLHLPALHTVVVHAGLLPADPLKSPTDPSQPLMEAASSTFSSPSAARTSEELSILLDIPQNTVPWNLMNIRSVYEGGRHKGEVTSKSKKGTAWSKVWKREMARCIGEGSWMVAGDDIEDEDEGLEDIEDGEAGKGDDDDDDRRGLFRRSYRDVRFVRRDEDEEGELDNLNCSPVTVIYGHAAGRGLDIKPFSKGIDTGCVYGRKLTALILGDTGAMEGQIVRVANTQGLLVNVECGDGGI